MMDYEFWFWVLIAFLCGRASNHPIIYIGTDKDKYRAAWFAILLRK